MFMIWISVIIVYIQEIVHSLLSTYSSDYISIQCFDDQLSLSQEMGVPYNNSLSILLLLSPTDLICNVNLQNSSLGNTSIISVNEINNCCYEPYQYMETTQLSVSINVFYFYLTTSIFTVPDIFRFPFDCLHFIDAYYIDIHLQYTALGCDYLD